MQVIYANEAYLIHDTNAFRSGIIAMLLLFPIVLPMRFDVIRKRVSGKSRHEMFAPLAPSSDYVLSRSSSHVWLLEWSIIDAICRFVTLRHVCKAAWLVLAPYFATVEQSGREARSTQ